METLNIDVVGLVQRLKKFTYDVLKCQSANGPIVLPADLTRFKSYVSALVVYKSHVVGSPQLDTPEYHPHAMSLELTSDADIGAIENIAIQDFARLLQVASIELVNSTSSRMSTGLISHDEKRFDSIMLKCNDYLVKYLETVLPLDLPESVPSAPGVSSGNLGINP